VFSNISVLLIDYFLPYLFLKLQFMQPRFMLKAFSPRIVNVEDRVGSQMDRVVLGVFFFHIRLSASFHQYCILIFHASSKLYDLSNSQRGWIKHFLSSSIIIWISNYVVLRSYILSCRKFCFIFMIVVLYTVFFGLVATVRPFNLLCSVLI
jgi:hypothetical protein